MPGDSGIFATCNKGREPKCVGELRDLFAEYAEQLYGDGADEDGGDGADGIENDIKAELAGIQKPPTAQLFVPVKLDVQCGEYSASHARLLTRKRARADSLRCSCFLQNRGSSRASQFRAEDLRRCHGKSYAQENEDSEASGAYDFDGEGHYGGIGGGSEDCAGTALPPGACDVEEGKW